MYASHWIKIIATVIVMSKNVSKKNLEKLKQYFAKNAANIKPGNRKDKNAGTKPSTGQ
jgi:hypothetical protein